MDDTLEADLVLRDTAVMVNNPVVDWDRSVFHNGETPDYSCPEWVDLTGLPRHVVFGPFVVLEPGLWSATIELELCPDAAKRHLVVDVGGDGIFTSANLPYRGAGRRRVNIVHRFSEGIRAEARVYLATAAFHGYLRFFGATLERLE